jgi:hypothetical protein
MCVATVLIGRGGGCATVPSGAGLGLSPGAGFEPLRPPWAPPRAAVKLGISKVAAAAAAAASPRWRLLLLLTSYHEAGSGDLRRNSYFENVISAVSIGIKLT